MKTLLLQYAPGMNVSDLLQTHNVPQTENVLVQVFTGLEDHSAICKLRSDLLAVLPKAKIIGATTAGEIINTEVTTDSTVLAIHIFQNTRLQTAVVQTDTSGESFMAGEKIANLLFTPQTKASLLFGTGMLMDGEEILRGISSVNDTVPIAGGLAGDGFRFQKTLVFTEKEIVPRGIVGVSFENPNLSVHTKCTFHWRGIGRFLKITKADGKRIYTIDNLPAADICRKYLGKGILSRSSRMQFPFVVYRNNLPMAKTIMKVEDEGSLVLSGTIFEGESVQFGYGDISNISDVSSSLYHQIARVPSESIFVFSCCVQHMVLGKSIAKETAPLSLLAPTSGFFTYGQFYHHKTGNMFMNNAMSALVLSEDSHIVDVQEATFSPKKEDASVTALKAFVHLSEMITDEIIDLNTTLEKKVELQTQKIQSAYDRLKVLDQKKDEFISLASHELRTPLSVIHGFVSLLLQEKSGPLTSFQRDALEKISKNVNGLLDFANRMISMSHSVENDASLSLSVFPLHALLEEVSQEIKVQYATKDILFRLSVGETVPLTLSTDRNQLKEVLSHLLKNAYKFTESGSIHLKVEREASSSILTFSVEDTGIGIPEEKQESIFEGFYQAEGYLHRKHEGIAVGLALAKNIVERLEGEISVKSSPGKGSTFSFFLPLSE